MFCAVQSPCSLLKAMLATFDLVKTADRSQTFLHCCLLPNLLRYLPLCSLVVCCLRTDHSCSFAQLSPAHRSESDPLSSPLFSDSQIDSGLVLSNSSLHPQTGCNKAHWLYTALQFGVFLYFYLQ